MSRTSLALTSWFCVSLAAVSPACAWASADLVLLTRSRFPDRAWLPLTGADAALVGAGRAVDPASGWSANPALLPLVERHWARGTGVLLDPHRGDVRGGTLRYSDASPLPTFGEQGVALGSGSHAWGLYVAQDAYDRARESFIDTTAGSPPIPLANEFTSSLGRAGLAGGCSLGKKVSVGAAFEVSRPVENMWSVPAREAQVALGVQEARVRLDGLCFGGAVGVFVLAKDWLALGASARATASGDLKSEDGKKVGRDEAPLALDLGVHAGRAAGGSLFLGAAYTGRRDVALGDSVGRGSEHSPRRVRLAAGYAYQPSAMPWEFRTGLGWSPYPGEGGARFSSFGLGVGYRMQGSVARLSYAREGRREPGGSTSARSFAVLSLDVRL